MIHSTTTTINTTIDTAFATTTVPATTVLITITPIPVPLQQPDPELFPRAAAFRALPFVRSVNDGSAPGDLYEEVLRGCRCLYLQPRTIQVVPTVTTVRDS